MTRGGRSVVKDDWDASALLESSDFVILLRVERHLKSQLLETGRQIDRKDPIAFCVPTGRNNLRNRNGLPKVVKHRPRSDDAAMSVQILNLAGSLPPLGEFHPVSHSVDGCCDGDLIPRGNAEEYMAIYSNSLSIFFTISEVSILRVGGKQARPLADWQRSGGGGGATSVIRVNSPIAALSVIPFARA